MLDKRSKGNYPPPNNKAKPIPTLAASTKEAEGSCIACKGEKHPLYSCSKFRSMSHNEMTSLLRQHGHCLNCLRHGHFVKDYKSLHHCKVCQRPHHSLLHFDKLRPEWTDTSVKIQSNLLLITCRVLIQSLQGAMQVRALLDSSSAVSFVSERVAQALRLRCFSQNVNICGITGMSIEDSNHSLTSFNIASVYIPHQQLSVSGLVVPHVTCNLSIHPMPLDREWEHVKDLRLVDLEFGKPGKIDLLLGVETFVDIVCHGQQRGHQGSPTAIETSFGWVLVGNTNIQDSDTVPSHHVAVLMGDNLLRQLWELEEMSHAHSTLTPQERAVINYFDAHHSCDTEGRFIVLLTNVVVSGVLCVL